MLPTNAKIRVLVKPSIPADSQAVVFFVDAAAKSAASPMASEAMRASANRLLAGQVSRGKAKEIVFDLLGEGKKLQRVYLAGLGKPDAITCETIRQSAGALAKALGKHRIERAAVILPAVAKCSPEAAADAIVTGLTLARFDYTEYKGTASQSDDEQKPEPDLAINIIAPASVGKAVARANVICEAQNYARTIACRPGNEIDPPELAKVAQAMARELGLGCSVKDERELSKLGMGGILAVGAGAIHSPPRLIVLEHRPKSAKKNSGKKPLLVVGKSITFDTGGISIKPADKMGKMIFDKCGGMAVLGLMYAAAKLDLDIPIVGILPSAENSLSSLAYRPGDILKMYNGVTVEVTNTDAEGRLVLADALAWGIETYSPAAVVDLATLTGGVIVALGRDMAGVMSTDDALTEELIRCGESAGEKIWRLPLGEAQREQIKSDPADIVNSAGREGHPLQGGAFLSYFVPTDGSVPWAHLDIAGVADTEKNLPYYAKGATGWGVRTLVNWAEGRIAKSDQSRRQ